MSVPRTPAPSSMGRRGVTLIELIVVIVVAGIVMAATVGLLVSNQRLFSANSEQVLVQQTVRAGVEVVAQELREVSPSLGDLLSISATQLQVRAVRRAGIVCAVTNTSPLTLVVRNRGQAFEEGDPTTFFVDNDVDTSTDDYWATGTLSSVSAGGTCVDGSTGDQTLALSGVAPGTASLQTRVGALVRAFESFTYGFVTLDGEPYLGRVAADGTSVPLVGPVETGTGIAFEYRDAAGNATTTPADVATVRVTVRASSEARFQDGRQAADEVTRIIHLRN